MNNSLVVPATRLVVLTCNPFKGTEQESWLSMAPDRTLNTPQSFVRKNRFPYLNEGPNLNPRRRKKVAFPDLASRRIMKFSGKVYKTRIAHEMYAFNSQPRKKCKLIFARS